MLKQKIAKKYKSYQSKANFNAFMAMTFLVFGFSIGNLFILIVCFLMAMECCSKMREYNNKSNYLLNKFKWLKDFD